MNIREYILSGNAELYAMGLLERTEKQEFEEHLLLHPELSAELQKAREVLSNYAQSFPRNPRPELRLRIVKSNSSPVVEKPEALAPTPILSEPAQNFTYKYLIAASLAALVVSTFASWFFYSRWNEAEDRYTDLLTEKNTLAMSFNQVKGQFDNTYSDMMVVHDENVRVITLTATDSTKRYKVRLFWNPYTHEVDVDALHLPPPDSGKQFQLWALYAGKASDAGLIPATTDDAFYKAKKISSADSWWITLEPAGGSTGPNPLAVFLSSTRN